MTKRNARLLLVVAAFLLSLSGATAFWLNRLLVEPYRGYAEDKLLISIHPGTPLQSIARTLETRGVVRHGWLLRGIFKWKKTEGQSKAGDYVFDHALTPLEVYDKLMKGEILFTVVTVPEGSNVFDIEKIFYDRTIGEPARFSETLRDPEVIARLHAIEPLAPGVEGFLFPETYFLGKKDPSKKALLIMLREFERRFGVAERRRAAELGFSVLQAVTLASLIEKETAQVSERALISGVFHNRLRLHMLLQCDPTVIYALQQAGLYRGVLRKADLQLRSPYNTYVSSGLPPGPICNPGADSLHAALYPETTDKLYFVSRNDGTHYFSATLAEHNHAVQRYRKN
ncbi:MAG TPA: endolytic transglycosylase MltG [Acidobacteriota bacterium]|nr:endolytic transglycosylase MltG [Acidobacteriota bacterium]